MNQNKSVRRIHIRPGEIIEIVADGTVEMRVMLHGADDLLIHVIAERKNIDSTGYAKRAINAAMQAARQESDNAAG
ncbi:MAG: hypothetical protein A2286_10540 [Gammaproteobacteria bacterium RIFOXYA12_FULL_61_12]|nr:MAG: hypothetical protein A2514_10170 [Gammaproteobacteria bacterium RIFOXYD12_FULL_61_37]OGT89766.1 MAG: hypothetical protein A2286_10540 [Gammaproteobacteria bacterium RIFOXYA12_FULL_61_12]